MLRSEACHCPADLNATMQLLVIRHAIAMEREEWAKSGRPDSDRPLTDTGRRRMRKNARGLQRVSPHPDVIATSPWLRAADTARVVADRSINLPRERDAETRLDPAFAAEVRALQEALVQGEA